MVAVTIDFRYMLLCEFPKLWDVLLKTLRIVLNLEQDQVCGKSPEGGRHLVQRVRHSKNVYVLLPTAHQKSPEMYHQ